MRLAFALAAMLMATPAQALTVSWIDQTSASFDLAITEGSGILTYEFLFGASPDPEFEAAEFSGYLGVFPCNLNCYHVDIWDYTIQIDCGIEPTCHMAGSLAVSASTGLIDILTPSLGFLVHTHFLRPLISSTITFTMPNPVPIPAALPLFAAALAGLGFVAWKRS